MYKKISLILFSLAGRYNDLDPELRPSVHSSGEVVSLGATLERDDAQVPSLEMVKSHTPTHFVHLMSGWQPPYLNSIYKKILTFTVRLKKNYVTGYFL